MMSSTWDGSAGLRRTLCSGSSLKNNQKKNQRQESVYSCKHRRFQHSWTLLNASSPLMEEDEWRETNWGRNQGAQRLEQIQEVWRPLGYFTTNINALRQSLLSHTHQTSVDFWVFFHQVVKEWRLQSPDINYSKTFISRSDPDSETRHIKFLNNELMNASLKWAFRPVRSRWWDVIRTSSGSFIIRIVAQYNQLVTLHRLYLNLWVFFSLSSFWVISSLLWGCQAK